ncbi:uncharacterized protein PG986_014531 [Apiospora aurea]|uniref:F-box domain-containing protein n=1 Tax=Apiospora aurea TaxID=335848 RepID=A0ABR1PTB7_9PEZI
MFGFFSTKSLIRDFPQLPTELLLVLFENLAPRDLLNLVQASPRCLQILESLGGTMLQQLFDRTLSATRHKETVHLHRPVAGLKALAAVVATSDAPTGTRMTLEMGYGFQYRHFKCIGADYMLHDGSLRDDHPLSLARKAQASECFGQVIDQPRPATSIETVKGAMLEHFEPFFGRDDLSATNGRWWWERIRIAGLGRLLTRGSGRCADRLPRTFGCEIVIGGVLINDVRDSWAMQLVTLRMRACRGVVRFTVQVEFIPELYGLIHGGTSTTRCCSSWAWLVLGVAMRIMSRMGVGDGNGAVRHAMV